MKTVFQNNYRALKIWWQLCPQTILSSMTTGLLQAVSPLTTIYLSARLITELAGGRDPAALLRWVVLILVVQAGMQLLTALAMRWKAYTYSLASELEPGILKEKLASLDYCEMERQYVFDLFNQIKQSANFNGMGVWFPVVVLDECFFPGLCRFLGGIALSVRLFTAQVAEGNPLVILNQPIFALVLLMMVVGCAWLAAFLSGRHEQIFVDFAPLGRLANRMFGFYLFGNLERERTLDMRMYNQQENICKPYFMQINPFGAKSPLGRKLHTLGGPLEMGSAAVTTVLTGAIYLFVCLKACGGAFGVGQITQYVGAITQSFLGMRALLDALEAFKANSAFLQTTYELMDIPNKMYQGSLTTEKRADRNYEIEFQNVSFRYPDTQTDVLKKRESQIPGGFPDGGCGTEWFR